MSKASPLLILASTSPYRRQLLQNFGVKFAAHSPKIDEEALKESGPRDLTELTRHLAAEKAKSLARDFPDAVILGSDQIADFAGERLDKPLTRDNAILQLQRLRGKEHCLITSLAVHFAGKTRIATDITRVKMREFDDQTIAAYVDLDQSWDSAGAYKIERAGMALIESVFTQDPSAIQGLPLGAMVNLLNQIGIPISELWRQK